MVSKGVKGGGKGKKKAGYPSDQATETKEFTFSITPAKARIMAEVIMHDISWASARTDSHGKTTSVLLTEFQALYDILSKIGDTKEPK